MNRALKTAKTGLAAVAAAKEAATLALHPVQWAKDKVVELLAKVLLESLTRTVGPQLAQAALDKLNVVDRTIPFEVGAPVPEKARPLFDVDALRVAQDAANEVLAGPLELLGYRLASVQVRFDEPQSKLIVAFEAGLMRSTPTPPELPAQPMSGADSPAASSTAGAAAAGLAPCPSRRA